MWFATAAPAKRARATNDCIFDGVVVKMVIIKLMVLGVRGARTCYEVERVKNLR